MPLVDVFGERKYQQVMNETWGHLKPKRGRVYKGHIVFTVAGYGGAISILHAEFKDLDDSPWFYEHMYEHVCRSIDRMHRKNRECHGRVFRFDGTYHSYKNGAGSFGGTIRTVTLVPRTRRKKQ